MDDSTLVMLLAVIAVIAIGFIAARLRSPQNFGTVEQNHIADATVPGTLTPIPRAPGNLSGLLPAHFVVLDLETTGLNPARDEIIEIGAIRVTLDSTDHLAFQTLVKPIRKIPAKITKINGITQEMVDKDGASLKDALCQFKEFVGELPFVTFNAEFDMAFLHNAAERSGLSFSNSYTCALKRARRAWPGLPSYRLSDLAKMGNLSGVDTHRAVGDCTRALIVFTSATSTLGQKVRWTKPSVSPFN